VRNVIAISTPSVPGSASSRLPRSRGYRTLIMGFSEELQADRPPSLPSQRQRLRTN